MATDIPSPGSPSLNPPVEDPAVTDQAADKQDGAAEEAEGDEAAPESVFQLHIKLPHPPHATSVMCSTHEYDQPQQLILHKLTST